MNKKQKEYIYAVARIRCRENKLFSDKYFEQMISINDIKNILRFVSENGWEVSADEDIFMNEQKQLWTFMNELVEDVSCFDFLRIDKDFHNLKVCVKCIYAEESPDSMLVYGGLIDPYDIYKAVKNKEYASLPEPLREAAMVSMSTLLQTSDGQLCDFIIDKACLDNIYSLGENGNEIIVRDYCELFVASANIKIAIRGLKCSKSFDFIFKSMSQCNSLDIRALALSATKSQDDVCAYLLSTKYKSAVPYIKESLSSFEKWADNYIMEQIKNHKSNPFSIASLIGYVFAKDIEIKTLRLIITAKANGLDDSVIRERLRKMYV